MPNLDSITVTGPAGVLRVTVERVSNRTLRETIERLTPFGPVESVSCTFDAYMLTSDAKLPDDETIERYARSVVAGDCHPHIVRLAMRDDGHTNLPDHSDV